MRHRSHRWATPRWPESKLRSSFFTSFAFGETSLAREGCAGDRFCRTARVEAAEQLLPTGHVQDSCGPTVSGRQLERDVRVDWVGTRVGFEMDVDGETTRLRFYHTGWPADNDHFRRSSYCWAMYLRLLKRFVEHDETVPYEKRLDA